MPADRTPSTSPTAVALLPSAAVYAVMTEGRREATVGERLAVPPPAPPVSSACALISPIWAYTIAAWSPDGRTPNDYVTSP